MLFPNDTSNKVFFYSSNESYTFTQDESGERRIDSNKSVKTNLKNFLEEYEFDDKYFPIEITKQSSTFRASNYHSLNNITFHRR